MRNHDYAWGKTYLGAVAILIPRSILEERPPPKEKAGTEAQFGRGAYQRGVGQCSVRFMAWPVKQC